MKKKEKHLVISFEATSMAMMMEKYCKTYNMPGRLIPLPPIICAGCGLAWQAGNEDIEGWMEFMRSHVIVFDKIQYVEI